MRLKRLVVRKHNGLIKVITEIRISCGYLAAIVIGKNAFSSAMASTARMKWGIWVSTTLIFCP